jgi:hypothetical protein
VSQDGIQSGIEGGEVREERGSVESRYKSLFSRSLRGSSALVFLCGGLASVGEAGLGFRHLICDDAGEWEEIRLGTDDWVLGEGWEGVEGWLMEYNLALRRVGPVRTDKLAERHA